MEDSPELDVQALFGSWNLLAGRGCGGDGVDPTCMSYLCRVRVAGRTRVGDTAVTAEARHALRLE